MNVEAWQAQQKAQKDEEKRKKALAAEALRGYRKDGLTEEETKLAALREHERRQKLHAEEQLRGYRAAGLPEDDAKLAAKREEERRKKLEAEQRLRGYGEAVSAPTKDNPSLAVASGAVSSLAATFTTNGIADANPDPSTETNESETPMMECAPGPTATDAPPAAMMPVQVKSRIAFFFGLISAEKNPSTEGYLAFVDQLVTETLGEEAKTGLAFEYPVVTRVDVDDKYVDPAGREGVSRRLVTVAIPFTAADLSSSKVVQSKVINAIQLKIQLGAFQKLF